MSATTHDRLYEQLGPWLRLMRLDRPVGTLLLLWPTLAALWMAAEGTPSVALVVVFALGTLLMRSAGCVVNDIADRNIDGFVARTRQRPLTTGELAPRQAWALFAALVVLAALLLPFLSPAARMLSVGGVAIAIAYPFAKRWTYLPQVVLGAAFSWGIVMAFAAVRGEVSPAGWLMFVGSLLWIVAYDTLYAMADREDDLRIGVKSTAILFGEADRLMIGILQACALWVFWLLGRLLDYGIPYLLGLVVMAALFVWQQRLVRRREPAACMRAFAANVWVGFALFIGTLLELYLAPWLAAAGG
jgi:4-hydroxybenzoate polyprenyltransferase